MVVFIFVRLSFLGCSHCFSCLYFKVVFIFMDIFAFQFNSIQSNSNLSVAKLSLVPMLCVLCRGSPYVVHIKCRDYPFVVHFNVVTVPTLCILNVGTVPTLCILNVGTVPTFSPSELIHLNDLHYLSLRQGTPQWVPWCWEVHPLRAVNLLQ